MRHVIALAEHGSFARAAAALGLSQPALSRSIQSLERDVATQLFVRTASGVEPTDSGRVLLARIRQIVQLTDELAHDVANERSLMSGRLQVGGGPYTVQSVMADALARFVADYPQIVARVMMREWDALLRALRAREIEFFVAEISTLDGDPDLAVEALTAHPVFIFGRSGHPLARRVPVSFADGLAYPNISLSRIPPRILEPMQAALRQKADGAAQRAFPALQLSSLDAVKKIVLRTDALVYAPLGCVEQELEEGRFVLLGSDPCLATRYGIVKLKTHALSPASRRFCEYVRDAEKAFTSREAELLERWHVPAGEPPPAPRPTRAPVTSLVGRKPLLRT